MHGGSRVLVSGTQASMGHQFGSMTEALQIEEDRVEAHGRQLGNARDRVQMGARGGQFAGLLHQGTSALQGQVALGLQPADMLQQ